MVDAKSPAPDRVSQPLPPQALLAGVPVMATPAAVNKTPDPRVQPEVEIAEDVFWAGRGERPQAGVVTLIPVNSQVANVSVPWAEP